MRHIYDFKKTTARSIPIRRRTKSNYGRKEKVLSVVFALIVIAWIYTFYFSSLFSIKNIQINGLETINKQSITDLLNASGKNIFRFNTTKATKDINDTYFLEDLAINKTYPSSLVVKISEKHPVFELNMPSYKYLLDSKGLVIDVAQSSSTARLTENLPLIEDANDYQWLIRNQALNNKQIEAINFFINNLKTENNVEIIKTIFNKTEEDMLTFNTKEGFQIMVSYKEDLKAQLFKITTFLSAQGDKLKNLLYINARFVDRVYYKWR